MKNQIAMLALLAFANVTLAAGPWKTEPTQSKLSFVGTQAGAEFEGVFQRFNAVIQFDPKDLGSSSIAVEIDLKSINSKDKERDDIIRGPDIFATEHWPTARYVADRFTYSNGKFVGVGKLTMRDVTREVPIEFAYQTDATGAWLKGSAKLKRLDFGVGQGEWRDTQWVANDVRVMFTLHLQH